MRLSPEATFSTICAGRPSCTRGPPPTISSSAHENNATDSVATDNRRLILLNLIFITLNNIPVCLIERRNGDFFLAPIHHLIFQDQAGIYAQRGTDVYLCITGDGFQCTLGDESLLGIGPFRQRGEPRWYRASPSFPAARRRKDRCSIPASFRRMRGF